MFIDHPLASPGLLSITSQLYKSKRTKPTLLMVLCIFSFHLQRELILISLLSFFLNESAAEFQDNILFIDNLNILYTSQMGASQISHLQQ